MDFVTFIARLCLIKDRLLLITSAPYRIIDDGYCRFLYMEGDHMIHVGYERLSGEYNRVVYEPRRHWLPPHNNEQISDAKLQLIKERVGQRLTKQGTTYFFR
jgi:hypothetical protein